MKIIFAFLLLCFVVLLVISCNTVHKSVQTGKTKTDSTHTSTIDAMAVSKNDSSGTKTEHAGYEKETVYQYDTVYRVIRGDTVLVYVPRIVKVYENGSFTLRETATKKNSDSVVVRQVDSTEVQRSSQSKMSDKKSLRMPIGLIIALGVALLMAVFILLRRPIFK